MSIDSELQTRSGGKCELCESTDTLNAFVVAPRSGATVDENILICGTCSAQINEPDQADPNHWRCLNSSIWSEVPAAQVVSWRMLNHLNHEGWAQDLLDMMYMDDETMEWAKTGMAAAEPGSAHKDSNGNVLQHGDTVVLIKDLDVKGANFTAKRGTAVRNIALVADNPEHIEGKVNGQHIVILTKFVKK
ncbi:MAG: PhnA domain-containing protein [Bacteroidia bacterium]|nr:PhnA domain-containing protein [Bacteroidia bacterium]